MPNRPILNCTYESDLKAALEHLGIPMPRIPENRILRLMGMDILVLRDGDPLPNTNGGTCYHILLEQPPKVGDPECQEVSCVICHKPGWADVGPLRGEPAHKACTDRQRETLPPEEMFHA